MKRIQKSVNDFCDEVKTSNPNTSINRGMIKIIDPINKIIKNNCNKNRMNQTI